MHQGREVGDEGAVAGIELTQLGAALQRGDRREGGEEEGSRVEVGFLNWTLIELSRSHSHMYARACTRTHTHTHIHTHTHTHTHICTHMHAHPSTCLERLEARDRAAPIQTELRQLGQPAKRRKVGDGGAARQVELGEVSERGDRAQRGDLGAAAQV